MTNGVVSSYMTRRATERQKKFIVNLSKGMDGGEAIIKAGYNVKNKRSAISLASETIRSPAVSKLLDNVGITEVQVMDKLKGALEAQKPIVSKDGDIVREYPDWLIQLKSSELLLKLMGYLRTNEVQKPSLPPDIKVQFIKVNTNGDSKVIKTIKPPG